MYYILKIRIFDVLHFYFDLTLYASFCTQIILTFMILRAQLTANLLVL